MIFTALEYMLALHMCNYQIVLNCLQKTFLPDMLWHYEHYPLINYLNSSKLKKAHLEYYH